MRAGQHSCETVAGMSQPLTPEKSILFGIAAMFRRQALQCSANAAK
jgi:hypothetical protein